MAHAIFPHGIGSLGAVCVQRQQHIVCIICRLHDIMIINDKITPLIHPLLSSHDNEIYYKRSVAQGKAASDRARHYRGSPSMCSLGRRSGCSSHFCLL